MEDFKNLEKETKAESYEPLSKEEWHNLVSEEVLRAQTYPETNTKGISIIFIDIDNMKEVNDSLSHLDGDETIGTLQSALALIRNTFRKEVKDGHDKRKPDRISYNLTDETQETLDPTSNSVPMEFSRLGGERSDEFGVICYTDSEGVNKVIDRLRDAFNYSVDERLRELGVDLAIGASTLRPGMDSSQLLREADRQMYVDKASHLPPLNETQQEVIRKIYKELNDNDIRPRDYIKYVKIYVKHIYLDL